MAVALAESSFGGIGARVTLPAAERPELQEAHLSRSRIKALIEEGRVALNGAPLRDPSKKLAEGSEGLVIDVKWGNGSFIKDLEQAKQLARSMTRVGRSMKRRCVALVTDMNQPLGDSVGTALEVKEAIQLLKGEGPEDMKELVLKLGMEIVRLAGVAAVAT